VRLTFKWTNFPGILQQIPKNWFLRRNFKRAGPTGCSWAMLDFKKFSTKVAGKFLWRKNGFFGICCNGKNWLTRTLSATEEKWLHSNVKRNSGSAFVDADGRQRCPCSRKPLLFDAAGGRVLPADAEKDKVDCRHLFFFFFFAPLESEARHGLNHLFSAASCKKMQAEKNRYLFDDKYLFPILPNQQRARSDFRLILYVVNYGRVGKCIMRKSKRYHSAARLMHEKKSGGGARFFYHKCWASTSRLVSIFFILLLFCFYFAFIYLFIFFFFFCNSANGVCGLNTPAPPSHLPSLGIRKKKKKGFARSRIDRLPFARADQNP
jgi:hypothetical protein